MATPLKPIVELAVRLVNLLIEFNPIKRRVRSVWRFRVQDPEQGGRLLTVFRYLGEVDAKTGGPRIVILEARVPKRLLGFANDRNGLLAAEYSRGLELLSGPKGP